MSSGVRAGKYEQSRVTWPGEECSVCGGSGGGGEHSTTPHCKHPGLTSTMMGQKVGGVWRRQSDFDHSVSQ